MYVNPARVWSAKARRGLTIKALAEAVGEKPRVVSAWIKPSGYSLDLTWSQVERLVLATQFPVGWFTGGDEEEDFSTIEEIGRQLPF